MTQIPTPRFSIGQSAWSYEVVLVAVPERCPDCLGTARWPVTAPSGRKAVVLCSTCTGGYMRNHKFRAHGSTRLLTVSSVRIDTADVKYGPVSYMMVETGIGSGTIWRESRLFDTEAEAKVAADAAACRRQAEVDTRAAEDAAKEKFVVEVSD